MKKKFVDGGPTDSSAPIDWLNKGEYANIDLKGTRITPLSKYQAEFKAANPIEDWSSPLSALEKGLGYSKSNLPKKTVNAYEKAQNNYVAKRLLEDNPKEDWMSRSDWLNRLTPTGVKAIENSNSKAKVKLNLFAQAENALMGSMPHGNANFKNASSTDEEFKSANTTDLLAPLQILPNTVNAVIKGIGEPTAKSNKLFLDAIKGKPSNMGVAKEMLLDPTSYVGAGTAPKIGRAAGKLAANEVRDTALNIRITKDILRQRKLINSASEGLTRNEEALLKNTRLIGSITKGGAQDSKTYQTMLDKAELLSDEQLSRLTGFTRAEIQDKIKALADSEGASAKKGSIRESDAFFRDRNSANERIENISLARNDRHSLTTQQRQALFSREDIGYQEEESLTDYANRMRTLGINSQELNALQVARMMDSRQLAEFTNLRIPDMRDRFSNYLSSTNIHLRDNPQSYAELDAQFFTDRINFNPWDAYINKKSAPTLSNTIFNSLHKSLSKNFMQEEEPKAVKSLISSLYKTETNNPSAQMLNAYKKVKEASSGETFIPSGSLSTDSYPMSLKLLEKANREKIGKIGFNGMTNLNMSGFPTAAGLPKDITVREINSIIDNMNKDLPLKAPKAYLDSKTGYMQVPSFFITKYKKGGWLNKY